MMMNDKKHIDRLFQEKLKDFEVTPNDVVWKNIEAKLKQKQHKKRVIPIWWRYAGIAAVLAILLTIGSSYVFENNTTHPVEPANDIVNTTNKKLPETNNTSDKASEYNENNSDKTLYEAASQIASEKGNNSETLIQETPVLKHDNNKKQGLTPKTRHDVLVIQPQTHVAKNVVEKPSKSHDSENNIHPLNPSSKSNLNTALAKNSENNKNVSENNHAIAEVKHEEEVPNNNDIVSDHLDENTLTIEEALANNNINEKEKEKLNRWSISPNAAPVYFNTLSQEGSSIDPQFENNPKSGEVNMSYGISASYAINRKLSIRSGVNRVNLGYNTNNIVRYQSYRATSSALQNVDTPQGDNLQSQENVSLISKENFNSDEVPENFSSSNTSVNQNFGYIEVPIEFQYTLSHKKFGVNVIGGVSSFFLNNSKIFSEVENGERTFLGQANNINKVSYSANFGLGFKYHISKKIDLNLEPMFKYQINTFNNTSGDFKPFILGTYTGFTIKF